MAIKINRIEIRCFKLFQKVDIDLKDASFVVLDGPNGFGKTSFFDAIELLFTGKIRRYMELANLITDKRETFKENSFLNDKTDGDMIIKAEFAVNGELKYLMRKGVRKILNKITSIRDFKLDLFELTDFNDENGRKVDDEDKLLTTYLNDNYNENFEFLNYVEQGEPARLLKCKDERRKESIGHLFNTIEFETIIEGIDEISSRIGQLCGTAEESKLKNARDELAKDENSYIKDAEKTNYVKLMEWGKKEWDQEEINFADGKYSDIVGDNGILYKIEEFIANIDDFIKYRRNERISKMISDDLTIKQMLMYFTFLDKANELSNQMLLNQEVYRIQQEIGKGSLSIITGKGINLANVEGLLANKIDIKTMRVDIEKIRKLQEKSNTLSHIVTSLKDSRNVFLEGFKKYEKVTKGTSNCPLCGYEWESIETFQNHVTEQSDNINIIVKENAKEVDELLDRLNKEYINPMLTIFQQYVDENKLDIEFVKGLQQAKSNENKIKYLFDQVRENGVELGPLLNTVPKANVEMLVEKFRNAINALYVDVEPERIKPYFSDIYISIFNENIEHVKRIQKEDLAKKKNYLKWKYSIFQSKALTDKRTKIEAQQNRYNHAKKLKEKISKVGKVYESSLKEYQKRLIGDIEVLFHVYSGRILQDHQGGLGLFISDKKGIRFLGNPEKSHDVIFSVSSGQIATLIIAFTLALNKKYSQNKLLFIDDPVQTLDELNIAGMIELLRNEFADHQVFVSTHEDRMSAYMRYKYEKYNIRNKCLSFKELFFENSKSLN